MKNMKEKIKYKFYFHENLSWINFLFFFRYSSHVGIISRVSCLPVSSHYIGLQVSKQIPTPAFKKNTLRPPVSSQLLSVCWAALLSSGSVSLLSAALLLRNLAFAVSSTERYFTRHLPASVPVLLDICTQVSPYSDEFYFAWSLFCECKRVGHSTGDWF